MILRKTDNADYPLAVLVKRDEVKGMIEAFEDPSNRTEKGWRIPGQDLEVDMRLEDEIIAVGDLAVPA